MPIYKVHCACKSRARRVRRDAPVHGDVPFKPKQSCVHTLTQQTGRQASENTQVAISNRGASRDIRARLRLRPHGGARAPATRHGARARASPRRASAPSAASAPSGGPGGSRRAGRHRRSAADSRRAASPRYPSGCRQIPRPNRPHQYGCQPSGSARRFPQ